MAAWGNILRRVQYQTELDSVSDGALLQQFVQQRSSSAFETLVRRHGTLVWRQCQRELMEPADAEDVLQATFLLLAQRAAQLRKPDSVAGWLVGVARRLARRLAMQQRKRREKLAQISRQQSVGDREKSPKGWWEEEKRFLSPEYQSVIDLCLIQGLSRDEAALHLNQTPAAVHGLLYRARLKLKKQLVQHGTAGSVVIMGTQASGAVIDRLAPEIARQAVGLLQSGSSTATAVSPVVATLMTTRKPIGWIISSLLAGALLAGGAGWWALASGYHLAKVPVMAATVSENNISAGRPAAATTPVVSPWRQVAEQGQSQQQQLESNDLQVQTPPPPRQSAEVPMPQQLAESSQKGKGAPFTPFEIPVPPADRVPSSTERTTLAKHALSSAGSMHVGMVPFLPRPMKQDFDGKTLLVSLIFSAQEYRDCTEKTPKMDYPPNTQVMRDPSWDGSFFQTDWSKEALLVVLVLEPTNCVTLSTLDKCWIAPDKNGVAHLLLRYDGKPPEAQQMKFKNYPYVMLKVQRKDLKQVAVTVWRTGDKPDAVATVPEK